MGTANRAPTADELARMTQMVGLAMHEGAFGLSTGLRYIPGFYSKTNEVRPNDATRMWQKSSSSSVTGLLKSHSARARM